MDKPIKILLISNIVNKSLKKAIEDVSAICEVNLVYSYDLSKLRKMSYRL